MSKPPDVLEFDFYDDEAFLEDKDIDLMDVIFELTKVATNKAAMLMMLKRYNGTSDDSQDVRSTIEHRLKELSNGN